MIRCVKGSSQEAIDHYWMEQALDCARQGPLSAYPNPRVGCVIVSEGTLVGKGFHAGPGHAHAEVVALQTAGARAFGATCYVTLAPCHHQGRTGPCTAALMAAGIARVVYAVADPNPLAGKGLEALVSAGIVVIGPIAKTAAIALNYGFFSHHLRQRPWVIAKLAMTLDGRTGPMDGRRQWISSSPARHHVHEVRAQSDMILTTAATVIQDNPRLDVRLAGFNGPLPHRVILDSQGIVPIDAALWGIPGPLTVVSGEVTPGKWGSNVASVALPLANGHVDLSALLAWMYAQGAQQVLIEAGATFVGAAMEAGLVDALSIYMAPQLLGHSARPLMVLEESHRAIPLVWDKVTQIGPDLHISVWVGEGIRCLQES